MNESILAAIKKKAEEKYPIHERFIDHYTSGQVDAIEKELLSDDGFLFWAAHEGYRMDFDNLIGLHWYEENKENSPVYATIELLTKYLENENG